MSFNMSSLTSGEGIRGRICYGVQGFVKVVNECGTKAGPNQKNFVWKMD